ncbi:MAG: TonB-dependent receptor [Edaphobacter sp.]|nr:TonB-dependent receptor [Edaphobacter sp.]
MHSQIFTTHRPSLFLHFSLLAALLFCVPQLRLYAQSAGTASVQGSVTDATGAAVPNANLVLTNTDTGTSRSTTSDSGDLYSIPNVPVGPIR